MTQRGMSARGHQQSNELNSGSSKHGQLQDPFGCVSDPFHETPRTQATSKETLPSALHGFHIGPYPVTAQENDLRT